MNTFQCGFISKSQNNNYVSYIVSKFKDIYIKFLPFFERSKIEGDKSLDFLL